MVTINIAYTAPINPSSASPVLTLPQVWAGLERKVRAGQDFVGAIVSTDVIGEELDQQKGCMVVTREVVFKERPGEKVREVCWLRSMSKPFVGRFYQTDGSTISNIISEGSKGAESGDLNMTYAFEWLQPDIDAKDKEAIEEKTKKYRGMARMAVEKSIESMRAMVVDGRIKT